MWIFLRSPGTSWCDDLARACREFRGSPQVLLLDLPPALAGAGGECAITIDDDAVTWGQVDLREAELVFIERPLFSWPQAAGRDEEGAQAEREARALALSALRIAGPCVAMVNGAQAGHWAAHPSAALDELAWRGIPVQPWRLGQRAPVDSAARHEPRCDDQVRFDAVGRALGYEPRVPAAGEPCRSLVGAPALPAWSALVVGGRAVAARVLETAAELASPGEGRALPGPELPARAARAAADSARALELDFCALTVGADGRVLDLDAAPDLPEWDRATGGALRPTLAAHLLHRTGGTAP